MKTRILLALSLFVTLNAQDLKTTVDEVLSTNPIILERLKNYNATKEDITAAESGYYPKLDLSLGVGFEHTDRDTPARGNESFDFGVYQNSLKFTQNIFKGYETTYQVKQQKNRTIAAAYSYVESVNDTSFKTVDAYLQVMKNKDLLENAQANVDINQEIFQKVKKLFDAGLTTLSEVNKIEASLALAKSNYIVQENTLLDSTYNLQRMLGRYLDPSEMSKPVLNVALPENIEEAASFAIKNNPSLLVSKYNIKLAQATYKESKSPFYPHIDVEISQAMNKNLSAVEGTDNRFRAMAYLTYNFFNGYADTAARQKSISNIHREVQVKNKLRRETIEGLSLSWSANEKLRDQLEHLVAYKEFALKTLTLYAKEYDLGRRSLLDLLSAQNDFIGAKAQIINTEYNLLFAKYRILDAMGTLVPTVIQDSEIVYATVGLNGETPKNEDKLPIHFDRDKDLIVDDKDLCSNSLSNKMRNIYGCKYIYDDVQRIERYTGFIFKDDSATLTENGEKMLNALIEQIEPYGFANLQFDILGNVENETMKHENLILLSKERAQTIKEKLIEAGALEENITLYANADEAPMYSDESKNSITLNNRADIIVKKLKK